MLYEKGTCVPYDKETGCSLENIQRYKQFGCNNFGIFYSLASDLYLIYVTGLTSAMWYVRLAKPQISLRIRAV